MRFVYKNFLLIYINLKVASFETALSSVAIYYNSPKRPSVFKFCSTMLWTGFMYWIYLLDF